MFIVSCIFFFFAAIEIPFIRKEKKRKEKKRCLNIEENFELKLEII